MITSLPASGADAADWPRVHALPLDAWRPALRAVEAGFALPDGGWERLPGGEDSAVFAQGTVVVKLVPPFLAEDAEREGAVLRRLALPVPPPRLLGVMRLDGWTALLLTRLAGVSAAQLWADLGPGERLEVMGEIGRLLVSIRGVPLAPEDGDAAATMTKLRARALRHEAAGFPAVDAFLDRHLPATPPAAFVHFDLNTGNLMLGREGGELRVTGVLDFVASRAFYPAFDLVTPGVFFALGDPALLGAMVRTAGLGAVGPEELASWHLLHPFSDLRRDLRMAGRAADPDLERAVVDLWISR